MSFASPCVLPVVPGYLGLVGATSTAAPAHGAPTQDASARARAESSTGAAHAAVSASATDVSAASTITTATAVAGRPGYRLGSRGRVVLGAVLFVLGFSLVYVLTGAAFGQLGVWLLQYQDIVLRMLGAIVLLMGLVFIGQVTFLQRQWKPTSKPIGLIGAPLLGVIFGVGWAPCVGPTLIAIQSLSFQSASAGRGALLAFAYCLGLGIPFVLAAVGFGAAARWSTWLRRNMRHINVIGGVLLMVIGLLMVLGIWQSFISWIGFLLPGYVSPL
ncbi:cytochrome c biogenesis protein CcdA [Pseudoclavibacter endophyticus]|uniref:Cytochrome c biogenesis protein CcdA n=1 Tax=Pseudoclavibacter endophyticus TaxID=1778590 RepID=A0A6H9WML5_9MICO|nr:cytochrome c biogenesis protein CcdA [Pseudoclavibacter endophyticus]